MSRAEMRRNKALEDKGKVKYTLTNQDLKAIQERAIELASSEAFSIAVATACIVLHDKFGFGGVRIDRFLDRFNELYADIGAKRLAINDVKQWCEDSQINLGFRENPNEPSTNKFRKIK